MIGLAAITKSIIINRCYLRILSASLNRSKVIPLYRSHSPVLYTDWHMRLPYSSLTQRLGFLFRTKFAHQIRRGWIVINLIELYSCIISPSYLLRIYAMLWLKVVLCGYVLDSEWSFPFAPDVNGGHLASFHVRNLIFQVCCHLSHWVYISLVALSSARAYKMVWAWLVIRLLCMLNRRVDHT